MSARTLFIAVFTVTTCSVPGCTRAAHVGDLEVAAARRFEGYPLCWVGEHFEKWDLEHVDIGVSLSPTEYIGRGLVLAAVALLYLGPPGPSQPAAVLPPPVAPAGEGGDTESDRADPREAVARAGARRRSSRIATVLGGGRALEGELA